MTRGRDDGGRTVQIWHGPGQGDLHVERIRGWHRLREIHHVAVGAARLGRVRGEGGRAALGAHGRGPGLDAVFGRVLLRDGDAVKIGHHVGLQAPVLGREGGPDPVVVHGGRRGIRMRPARAGSLGGDALGGPGPGHHGGVQGPRSGRGCGGLARERPQVSAVAAGLSRHRHVFGGLVRPYIRPFLRGRLFIGMPPPKMLGQGRLAAEAADAINGQSRATPTREGK